MKAHHWKRTYQPFIVKQVPSVISSIPSHYRKTSVVGVVYIIGPGLKESYPRMKKCKQYGNEIKK